MNYVCIFGVMSCEGDLNGVLCVFLCVVFFDFDDIFVEIILVDCVVYCECVICMEIVYGLLKK